MNTIKLALGTAMESYGIFNPFKAAEPQRNTTFDPERKTTNGKEIINNKFHEVFNPISNDQMLAKSKLNNKVISLPINILASSYNSGDLANSAILSIVGCLSIYTTVLSAVLIKNHIAGTVPVGGAFIAVPLSAISLYGLFNVAVMTKYLASGLKDNVNMRIDELSLVHNNLNEIQMHKDQTIESWSQFHHFAASVQSQIPLDVIREIGEDLVLLSQNAMDTPVSAPS